MNTRDWFKLVWIIVQAVFLIYIGYSLLTGGEVDWSIVFGIFILSQLSLLDLDMQDIYVEVFVHGDWIVEINYHTNSGVHTKTYRIDEGYGEEEAVREAYTMFIAELGVEYSNSLLASSDIVIINAGQLPTPSYRTIKLN